MNMPMLSVEKSRYVRKETYQEGASATEKHWSWHDGSSRGRVESDPPQPWHGAHVQLP